MNKINFMFYSFLLYSIDAIDMRKIIANNMPMLRNIIYINNNNNNQISDMKHNIFTQLRVLQFNMLADGLSGLRNDLGAFSRAKKEDVIWENRKLKILYEILQYDPDIVTLQECDHYYDYFLPELSVKGYDGLFAPKPASACLEVSDNSDGCAIFFKRDKFSVTSVETITYALSKNDVNIDAKPEEEMKSSFNSFKEEDQQVRPQNQVALIAVCNVKSTTPSDCDLPFIVATTHLKAAKNKVGEMYRLKETQQLLQAIDKCRQSIIEKYNGKSPAIIITGDFNACPEKSENKYDSIVYPLIKSHPLNYRSVLNDDLRDLLSASNKEIPPNIWTTWKARRKNGKEVIAKHCIDYIFYNPPALNTLGYGVKAISTLDLFDEESVSEELFPSSTYPSDHISVVADLQIVKNIENNSN